LKSDRPRRVRDVIPQMMSLIMAYAKMNAMLPKEWFGTKIRVAKK